MARRVAEQIGKARYNVFNEQYSYGAQEVRDGVSFSKREEDKSVVTPDEIMQLPDLSCFVTYPAELPATRITLNHVMYPAQENGFIERVFDCSLKTKKENNQSSKPENSKNNLPISTSDSSNNKEKAYQPLKKNNKGEQPEQEVRKQPKIWEDMLHNREEVNLNHARDENDRSHDDMDIVP